MKIYVATSWRNDYQPDVIRGLRELGHEIYDFRNPKDGDTGFHWSSIDPKWRSWDVHTYVEALSHPIAVKGFNTDFDAMSWAEGCVLVMPCGRSAHLEAGWFVGHGKPLWILTCKSEPELMYKIANGIYPGLGPLLLDIQAWEETQAEKQDSAMTDQREFYQETLGISWVSDPILTAMRAAVNEYHKSCEAYDKTVCTGRMKGDIAIPETTEQWWLVVNNRKLKSVELLLRVSRELEIPRETAESYWREAMRIRR